jgi:hypothetical protein
MLEMNTLRITGKNILLWGEAEVYRYAVLTCNMLREKIQKLATKKQDVYLQNCTQSQ